MSRKKKKGLSHKHNWKSNKLWVLPDECCFLQSI